MSDKTCPCCGGNGWEGSDCANAQAELETQLAAERALADRLARVLFGCTARDQNDAYDAWKEARK